MSLITELTKHEDSLHIADNEEASGYFEGLENLPNVMEVLERTRTSPEWKTNWIKVNKGYIIISDDDCGGMNCMFVADDKVVEILQGKFMDKDGDTYDDIKLLSAGDYAVLKGLDIIIVDFVTDLGNELLGMSVSLYCKEEARKIFNEMT